MAQTSIDWLEERLKISLGDELKSLRGFFVIAKEMYEKESSDAYEEGWEDATKEIMKKIHKYQ